MKRRISTDQSGFHALPLILILFVIGAIIWTGINIGKKRYIQSEPQEINRPEGLTRQDSNSFIKWEWKGDAWATVGNAKPPDCPEPFEVYSPVDLSRVPSVMYPGQVRGGDYKPHGGFRIKAETGPYADVKAPFDAYVVDGSRYIEGGAVQYLFTFVHPCGMAYRFDHLHTLAGELQALTAELPEAKVDDSRTTQFKKPLLIKQGTIVATSVGAHKDDNHGFDFGVYDLRTRNTASRDPGYAARHQAEASQAFHALCWLDMLTPASDLALVRSLPGDDMYARKSSDYCK